MALLEPNFACHTPVDLRHSATAVVLIYCLLSGAL
jgi:hypothetical protein